MARRLSIAALAAALLAPGAAGSDEILVACAVSLREPATRIGRLYEADRAGSRLRFSFGSSSALAVQARAGAPIDVLITADDQIADKLEAEGLLAPGDRFALASNRLVVVERPELRLRRAEDLAAEGVRRIAIPMAAVPLGRYAREWLRARHLLDRLAPRIVVTEHARATLAAVDHGHADAAIVYTTDTQMARSARVAFRVDEAEQPRITYAAALLRSAEDREGARAFFEFLRSPPARRSLTAAGFLPPIP